HSFPKRVSLEVAWPSRIVGVSAQSKAAGMISPAFATMFCFVQTDAALAPETADLLLGVTVKRSFDRISVDGQLSTNDTAILMANGASGVEVAPESEDELRLGEALDAVLRQLALMIVRDGDETALADAVQRDEVEYVVGLPGSGHETEVFFSDLSHEYVSINAEYTT